VTAAQILCTQSGRITINNPSGIAPFLYSINTGQGLFQQANTFTTGAGNYTITTKDSLGCTTTANVAVVIAPEFKVDAGPDAVIVAGDQVLLTGTSSEPATSVSWTPSAGLMGANNLQINPRPMATTTYVLSATNTQGCVATDNVQVTVIPYCIKIKNAFTPNGDGNNDLWQVYDQFDCLKNVDLQVFNRYGSKVYEARNYRNTWNGTYQGKPVPDGTYYAVVNFTLINGKVITLRSDLTILR
jgi:gliding motility-associated-like protein